MLLRFFAIIDFPSEFTKNPSMAVLISSCHQYLLKISTLW